MLAQVLARFFSGLAFQPSFEVTCEVLVRYIYIYIYIIYLYFIYIYIIPICVLYICYIFYIYYNRNYIWFMLCIVPIEKSQLLCNFIFISYSFYISSTKGIFRGVFYVTSCFYIYSFVAILSWHSLYKLLFSFRLNLLLFCCCMLYLLEPSESRIQFLSAILIDRLFHF